MKYKSILTKEFLEQKYWIEELSIHKIAKAVGCGNMTVFKYLKKYNISIRTRSEARKGKFAGKNNLMYGKHHSEETKRKMKLHHANVFGKNNPMYGVHRWGEENPNWKDGRNKHNRGYIFVYSPNHLHKNVRNYVLEHRLVVEKYLGRYLLPTEVVHHINGVRDDNRIENLICFINNPVHRRFHKNPNNVKSNEITFDGRKYEKK